MLLKPCIGLPSGILSKQAIYHIIAELLFPLRFKSKADANMCIVRSERRVNSKQHSVWLRIQCTNRNEGITSKRSPQFFSEIFRILGLMVSTRELHFFTKLL